MTDRELMQQALEWAEAHGEIVFAGGGMDAVNALNSWATALRERLAQPEQEPAAWMTPDGEGFRIRFSPPVNDVPLGWDALYATPPQRTWVGLTDDEIDELSRTMVKGNKSANWLCRAIEAKLKEKNNGN